MIIFGTRGVTYSAASSDFYCPNCNENAPYKHKRVRRFFTLYFIPVIPLDLHGEYVECQKCRGTYQLKVLELNPQADMEKFEAAFQLAMKRVMVLMMLADGVVDPEEVQVIRDVYGRLARSELSESDVMGEVEQARSDGLGIEDYLVGLAGNLNDTGKEMVLKSAILVAAADGEFQEEEMRLLMSIGQALEMTPAHVKGVLHSMTGDDDA